MKTKRFRIIDNDKEYEVIEETEEEINDADIVEEDEFVEDEDELALTLDEISTLKLLASRADDILKLLDVEKAEHEAIEEEIHDEDIDGDEEILDTNTQDSKKAFGSLQAKDSKVVDNSTSSLEIEDAWAKRYGGKR